MRQFKPWDMILVTWADAFSDLNQRTFTSAKAAQPSIRKTIGFFVDLNEDRLVLCGTDDRHDKNDLNTDVADLTVLPRGMVVRVDLLGPVTRRVK